MLTAPLSATPHGLIKAAWGYDTSGKLQMELTAPKGTMATIVPPVAGTFKVDGTSGQSGSFVVKGGNGAIKVVQE